MHHPPTPPHRKAATQGLLGAGIIVLMLFMSSFLLAGALGLIESGDRPGIGARVVMFCFGGIIFGMASFVGWRIIAETVGPNGRGGLA